MEKAKMSEKEESNATRGIPSDETLTPHPLGRETGIVWARNLRPRRTAAEKNDIIKRYESTGTYGKARLAEEKRVSFLSLRKMVSKYRQELSR